MSARPQLMPLWLLLTCLMEISVIFLCAMFLRKSLHNLRIDFLIHGKNSATHYYEETAHAQAGASAWRNGNLNEYGRLIFESGYSSIANYECGCDELKTLYTIMRSTDGIYGGRFSGAGFKGCCMAFIDPSVLNRLLNC